MEPVFVQGLFQEASIPKKDLRKKWANITSERDKKMEQLRYLKEQFTYYLSKTNELEYELNRLAEEIERLRPLMIADVMSIQGLSQEASIPKEDLRKKWANITSERDKKLEQLRYLKEQFTYYSSKTKELEYELNRLAEEIERLRPLMFADVMTQQ